LGRSAPALLAAAVLVVLILVVQSLHFRDFSIDDAGITWRYARNLADGHGLVWNPDGPRVEGYSNFLWVLVLAGSRSLGFDIEASSHVLGILLGAVTLVTLLLVVRRFRDRGLLWWLPVILVGLNPWWVMWLMSGLESAAFGFFLTLYVYAFGLEARRRALWLSVAVVGLVLIRPEGAALAAIPIAALWLVPRPVGISAPLMPRLIPVIALVATATALVVFRLWYFGYPLANTVYAKFDSSLPSAPHVLDWLIFAAPFFVLALVTLRQRLDIPKRRMILSALALVILEMAIVLPVVPVMYFLHRYQIALLPLLVLAVPAGLAPIHQRHPWLAYLIAVILIGWSLQGWPGVEKRLKAERYSIDRQSCIVHHLQQLSGKPTIALIDAGRIPYWTDLPAIDAWGLCDLTIARGGFSMQTILKRQPDVYIMSMDIVSADNMWPCLGLDQIIYVDPRFREHYTLYKICAASKPSWEWRYDYAIFTSNK
jgi:hypothetical protein